MSGFTGLVLAGGRSSRMGRDKAMLVLDGATLLDRACTVLRAAGATRVLIAGPAGIADPALGLGPLGGLANAIGQGVDGALVVLPVGMPRLSADLIELLHAALAQAPAARYAGHSLPWALRVDDRLRQAVAARLAGRASDASLRALHADVAGVDLPPPPGADLRNVNTPEDWADLLRTR